MRENFTVTFSDVKPINKEFVQAKVWVCYSDLNRNKSDIPKQVIINAIPSIFNIPVVGEWLEDKQDFGSHGGKIVITNDSIDYIRTTTPIGVVPSDANVQFEINPDDGREYLTVDGVILWQARFEEQVNAIIEDGQKGQSMEVEFTKSFFNEKTGINEVQEMNFSALCILGDNVSPAFEGAKIETFAYSRDEIIQQMKELMFEFSRLNDEGGEKLKQFDTDSKKEIPIDNSKESAVMDGSWGDVDKSALRDELTSAENATSLVDEGYLIVDTGWDNDPSEALHYPHHVVKDGKLVVHKEGLQSAYARLMQNDPHNEKAIKHVEKHYRELGLDMSNFSLDNFSLSSEQLEGELRRIVSQEETFQDPFWGWTEQRYYYIDSQDDVVVVQDCQLGGLVGFKFTVTGDLVSVNFDSGLRYKIDWVPMDVNGKPDGDEGVTNASDGDEFSLMPKERLTAIANEFSKVKEEKDKLLSDEDEYKTQIEEMNSKFEEVNSQFELVSTEVDELRQFKLEKETAEREQKVNDVLAKFASHLTEDEIETFKSNATEISIEEMETQLFALIGRKMSSENFSLKSDKTLRVPLFAQEEMTKQVKKSNKPYAELIEANRVISE